MQFFVIKVPTTKQETMLHAISLNLPALKYRSLFNRSECVNPCDKINQFLCKLVAPRFAL